MSGHPMTRRRFGHRFASAAPSAPQDRNESRARIPPSNELVNVLEFDTVAETVLPADAYARIAGSDRTAFDRMTFRQRLMVKATDLDLSMELFGTPMFAPILVGPVSGQDAFHPDGELETARGAAAASATMVVSSRSRHTVAEIAREVPTPLWFQVYSDEGAETHDRIRAALDAGVQALCITRPVGDRGATGPPIDWSNVDRLRQDVDIPVLIKGIMSADEATTAIDAGAQGIVVSNHGAASGTGRSVSPIDALIDVAEVAGSLPLLIDGSFRRGSDILKALALGAQAVLIARPAMWGLAAYGAAGVQAVLELLYNDLARSMAASGRPTIPMIDRPLVKIHSR